MKNWLEQHIESIVIIATLVIVIGGYCLCEVNYSKTHVEKSEPMAVEILDKRENTTTVPVRVGKVTTMQTRHHYYINTEVDEFSVGNNVYNKYDKGDVVFITKTDVYEIKDGREIYEKTEYEWGN